MRKVDNLTFRLQARSCTVDSINYVPAQFMSLAMKDRYRNKICFANTTSWALLNANLFAIVMTDKDVLQFDLSVLDPIELSHPWKLENEHIHTSRLCVKFCA